MIQLSRILWQLTGHAFVILCCLCVPGKLAHADQPNLPQIPAADAPKLPSVVVGTKKSCPGKVGSLKAVLTCNTVPPTSDEVELIKSAASDLNKVLASPLFRDAILAASFDETEGKSVQEIYKHVLDNSPLRLDVTLYTGGIILNKWSKNQGFEDQSAPNTCFGNRYAIQGRRGFLGSLMLHEAMHVLGFRHNKKPRTKSVPYVMNTIYDAVAGKLGLATSYTDAQ